MFRQRYGSAIGYSRHDHVRYNDVQAQSDVDLEDTESVEFDSTLGFPGEGPPSLDATCLIPQLQGNNLRLSRPCRLDFLNTRSAGFYSPSPTQDTCGWCPKSLSPTQDTCGWCAKYLPGLPLRPVLSGPRCCWSFLLFFLWAFVRGLQPCRSAPSLLVNTGSLPWGASNHPWWLGGR